MTVRLATGYKKHGGIVYFKSAHRVHASGTLHPEVNGRPITVDLIAYQQGRWVRVDEIKLEGDDKGSVAVYLNAASAHQRYRLVFSFHGDRRNGSSSTSAQTFIIS